MRPPRRWIRGCGAHGGVPDAPRAAFGNPGSASHEYGEAASELVEAASSEVAAAVGAEPADSRLDLGRDRGEQPRHLRRRPLLPRRRPAYRDGAHRAQGGPRPVPRTRAARLARHLSRPTRDGVSTRAAGGGAQARHGAGLAHARQQRDRRDPGYRRDCGAVRASSATRGCTSMRRRASASARRFRRARHRSLSLSAHKAYGPKGAGALVGIAAARRASARRCVYGGGQERGCAPARWRRTRRSAWARRLRSPARRSSPSSARIARLEASGLWQRACAALGGVYLNGDARASYRTC
jgi:cysteine desulfurase